MQITEEKNKTIQTIIDPIEGIELIKIQNKIGQDNETEQKIETMADNTEDTETEEVKIQNGVHNYSSEESYVMPTDPKVLQKLEWFQDQKLALMMHWGPYSQLGIVESWALSDADAEWSRNGIDWEVSGQEFKKQYFDLNKTFNPIRFEPEKWAELAEDMGAGYFIFTTKHHDGFCMWDTKYSNYKITAPDCPFHKHKYADICGHLFEAMRKKHIGIAAYFSKADWHIDSYWNDKYDRGNYQYRGPSYDPNINKEEWDRFVTFTQNQIHELASQYGKIDIMWFDAGWVCEQNGQDIRLGEIIDKIRKFQPGMLSADRTVGGDYENYVTPEQCVPEYPMSIPFESNVTLGTSFSFAYEDNYKSVRDIVLLLIDVVAKGGNLAVNVGPQPDGRIPRGAVMTLRGLGEWLRAYGDCIYGTRVCEPFKQGRFAFTKKQDVVYAIELFEQETQKPEQEVLIPYKKSVMEITMLDSGEKVDFEKRDSGYMLKLPPWTGETAPYVRVFCMR